MLLPKAQDKGANRRPVLNIFFYGFNCKNEWDATLVPSWAMNSE